MKGVLAVKGYLTIISETLVPIMALILNANLSCCICVSSLGNVDMHIKQSKKIAVKMQRIQNRFITEIRNYFLQVKKPKTTIVFFLTGTVAYTAFLR